MKHNRTIMRALAVLIACLLLGGLTAKAEKRPWVKIENNVMTFLYGEKETLQENEYGLNEGENEPAWHGMARKIKKVVFDASFKDARPTSCYEWFKYFSSLTAIEGMENLNTSEVTTMEDMFWDCDQLPSLDVSNFDTRKVTDMQFMFCDCSSLANLDLSNFDTQNVENMRFMFSGAYNLQKIFVGDKFSTEKLTNSGMMFSGCYLLSGATGYDSDHGLTYSEGKNFANTKTGFFTDVKLKDEAKYYWVGYDNGTLTYYYGKKTALAENESYMRTMFNPHNFKYNTDNVETAVLDASLGDARPTCCEMWFSYPNLTEIKGLENLNTSEMTDMGDMFRDCKSLSRLDLSHFNTSKVTDMGNLFGNCLALQELDLSSFDTRSVTNMGIMFTDCYSLASLDLSTFNTSKVTNMYNLFNRCTSLKYIFVGDGFVTSQVEDSDPIFKDNFSLTGAISFQDDKTGIEYANKENGYLTDVKYKGQAKYGWTKVDGKTMTFYYGKKDKLEDGEMFLTAGYRVVTDDMVNVTKAVFDKSFKEARPVSCIGWFFQFQNLADIEGWENVNTEKVADMDYMFYNCRKLKSVDLSGLNTENVTSMRYTFTDSKNLKSVYLGEKFITTNVTDTEDMYNGCPATFYCPANSYAAISASKVMEGRDLMAYANINPTAEYGTLCVPQGSDLAADTFEGFDKLYSVSKVEGGQAILKEEKQLQPGKAYIYHNSLPADYFKAVAAYKPNGAAAAEPLTDALLRGTFTETTAPANSYVLQEDAMLHLAAADGTTAVGANQAYLLAEGGAALPSTLSIKIDDASGINGVIDESEAAGNGRVYDLMGRRVSTLVKGNIYIRNGKKIQL